MNATGYSASLHHFLFAKTGCLCHKFNLPWPAVTAAAYMLVRDVLVTTRDVVSAACEEVGGVARTLQPRVETSYNTSLTFASIAIGLLFLDSLGVTLSTVWGVLGVGGVAISLGVKDIIADIASGLLMMTSPTFRVGDWVKAGDVEGTVMSMGPTKTTLLTRNGAHKTPRTVSNNVLTSSKAGIINFALAKSLYFDHELRVRATSVDSVMKLCAGVDEYLIAHPIVIKDPMDAADTPRQGPALTPFSVLRFPNKSV